METNRKSFWSMNQKLWFITYESFSFFETSTILELLIYNLQIYGYISNQNFTADSKKSELQNYTFLVSFWQWKIWSQNFSEIQTFRIFYELSLRSANIILFLKPNLGQSTTYHWSLAPSFASFIVTNNPSFMKIS